MCVLTVVSLMNSCEAISALESPRAISWRTSSSRSVRSSNAWGAQPGRAGELVDHVLGDGGGEEGVSSGDDADRGEQLFGWVVLEHEAAGAGAERFVDVVVEVESCQDRGSARFCRPRGSSRRLEAVQLGHADVHRGRRGPERAVIARLEAVAGLGDHLDVGFVREQHPEAGADHATGHRRPGRGCSLSRSSPPAVER